MRRKSLGDFYSLVANCKLNDINPYEYEYFYDILPKVASYPSHKIADLIPTSWKLAKKRKTKRADLLGKWYYLNRIKQRFSG
jgi:hypothetical protein